MSLAVRWHEIAGGVPVRLPSGQDGGLGYSTSQYDVGACQHRGPSLAIQPRRCCTNTTSQVLYPKATLLTILVAECLRA